LVAVEVERWRRLDCRGLEATRDEHAVVALCDVVPDELLDLSRAVDVRAEHADVELDRAEPRVRGLIGWDVQAGTREGEDDRVRIRADGMSRGDPPETGRGDVTLELHDGALVGARRREREVGVAVEIELEGLDRELRASLDVPRPEVHTEPHRVPDVGDR